MLVPPFGIEHFTVNQSLLTSAPTMNRIFQ